MEVKVRTAPRHQRTATGEPRNCRLCGLAVASGDELAPASRRKERGFLWAHRACAVPGGPRPACVHWTRRGTCAYGTSCFFSHDRGNGSPLNGYTERLPGNDACLALHTTSIGDVDHACEQGCTASDHAHGGSEEDVATMVPSAAPIHAPRRGGAVSKCGRTGHFRRFLLSTFGAERLRRGTGVLDVAGGKGELAFELQNLHSVSCTPQHIDECT